jgi:hypothetical protein
MQLMVHPYESRFEFYHELQLDSSIHSGTWQGMARQCLSISLGLGMETKGKEKQGKARKAKERHENAKKR